MDMEVNLLGHCLLCLGKAKDDSSEATSSSSTAHDKITRKTFATKVLPQLLLDRTAKKENGIKNLFNKLCFYSGSGGDHAEGQEELSPPSFCSSCLEKMSTLTKLLDKVESKKEEIRSKIPMVAEVDEFKSFLRGSEVVEEDVKDRTILLLDCLREECCEETIEITCEDKVDGGCSSIVPEEVIIDDDDDDVVELPVPPPKEIPVIDISDDVEVDDDAPGVMEEIDQEHDKVLEVEEFRVLPENLLVVEVNPQDIQQQDSWNPGSFQEQMMDVDMEDGDPPEVLELESGPADPSLEQIYPYRNQNRIDYICNICGKGFTGTGHLKAHLQAHLGIKPFRCPNLERGCQKSYSSKSSLRNHLRNCKFGIGE